MRAQAKGQDGIFQRLAEQELDRLQFELARLDFGKIQDLIDQGQQSVAGFFDRVEQTALLGAEFGLQGQTSHAENAIHGSSNLVADVGQELALGAVGGFGLVFG